MRLDPAQASAVDARIAQIESRTGVRVTTVIVGKSDSYLELPWKAFALGASFAALGTVLAAGFEAQWYAQRDALCHAIIMLGIGAASALAAVWIPAWARLFLRPSRRDVEVRQHAQAIFLTRELFATKERTGLLILVSRFERKIQLWPDVGLRERVSAAEWHTVIARMTPSLRAGRPSHALHEGLSAVEELLVHKGIVAAPRDNDEGRP